MEKLWTAAEAARYLDINESDGEGMVRDGKLTGYQLGGQYLRFRPDQVKSLKGKVSLRQARAAAPSEHPESWSQQVREFVYFYDFYLVSAVLMAALVVYLIAAG